MHFRAEGYRAHTTFNFGPQHTSWRIRRGFESMFWLSIHILRLKCKPKIHSWSKCLVWVKKCCHIWLDQNFDPSLLTKKLWPFYMRMKHFFFFFVRKKNFKMADWKKAYFPKSPILKIFSRKFHGLVLGLVGLNDAKPIDLAQPIWRWGCLKKALKQAKNVFFVFLGPFRAYVGQPQGHIGWAISMGFASFNPTKPRTNPWNFGQ